MECPGCNEEKEYFNSDTGYCEDCVEDTQKICFGNRMRCPTRDTCPVRFSCARKTAKNK